MSRSNQEFFLAIRDLYSKDFLQALTRPRHRALREAITTGSHSFHRRYLQTFRVAIGNKYIDLGIPIPSVNNFAVKCYSILQANSFDEGQCKAM